MSTWGGSDVVDTKMKMLSPYELQAGVTAPTTYGSMTDESGNLKQQFQVNPYSGEAMQMLKQNAMGSQPSAWAQMQTQAQQQMQGQASDQATRQQMQAQQNGMSNLSRMGGATGGAQALLARSGARDELNAQQGVAQQGIQSRLNINAGDAQQKQGTLANLGNAELQSNQLNQQTQFQNNQGQNMFDVNRYNQQLQAWGATQTANATRAAGHGGKK